MPFGKIQKLESGVHEATIGHVSDYRISAKGNEIVVVGYDVDGTRVFNPEVEQFFQRTVRAAERTDEFNVKFDPQAVVGARVAVTIEVDELGEAEVRAVRHINAPRTTDGWQARREAQRAQRAQRPSAATISAFQRANAANNDDDMPF